MAVVVVKKLCPYRVEANRTRVSGVSVHDMELRCAREKRQAWAEYGNFCVRMQLEMK